MKVVYFISSINLKNVTQIEDLTLLIKTCVKSEVNVALYL